ncbi:LytTR family DNA-binding domain-containing protein [Pseudogracilibacillus sp. SE30717A]|uniref:LytTR family DNA-binding domain-containing protein n=1 Tax=Pseudogracilibacillus sp. SE30717A TaxID=3098293 RepID=UPI00300E29AE
MKIQVDIDDQYEETSITIQTNEWTEELERLLAFIKSETPKRLFGIEGEQTILLDPEKIDFIYSENRKVYAAIDNRHLEIRLKLYEVEEMLSQHHFMRFSKSVIGNIDRITRFELSFNGNLCVYFQSGNKEYITRKYVTKVKNKLMTGGKSDDI